MTSLSEFALFKECVHNPRFLDKNLNQLNLQFIKDPAATESPTEIEKSAGDSLEITQRKALRLFYMVWSGVTKCLRNMIQQQRKAIEIPNFAIFGPISETNQGRNPLDKGFANTQRQAEAAKLGICPVFVVVNDDYLNQMNWEVALDQTSEKAVGRFNKLDKTEVIDLFRNKIQPLAISSIASVCMTDSATVDNVLKEIFKSLGDLACEGRSLRLNFKVGYLIVNNQLMQWQHSRELLRRHKVSQSIDQGSRMSSAVASEIPSQAISVITPSIARHSRASSTDYRNFHISNPNPQSSQTRFNGPRDTASKGMHSPEKADMIRFGKKIAFGKQITNEELLQDHLQEMRQHLAEKKMQRNMQIEADKEFLGRVADRDLRENQTKMRSSDILKNEFKFFNDQKQLDNKLRKEAEREQHQKDKHDFFPFVSGELLEQHRKELTGTMRADLQNYLVAKSQGLVNSSNNARRVTGNRYGATAGSNGFYPTQDGAIDLRGDRLVRNNPIMAGQVKALHDSCYQKPDQNPRVIKDTDLAKNVAWKQALERHENQIYQQKNFNEVVMSKHFQKVKADESQLSAEQENRRQKQKRFNEEIKNQMTMNDQSKRQADEESRKPMPTSFGPEESEAVVMRHRLNEQKKKQEQRLGLTNQMVEKKAIQDLTKKCKLNEENAEMSENQQALVNYKASKDQAKNEAKQFWQEQLQATEEQRQKEKDASDVYKKQIEV